MKEYFLNRDAHTISFDPLFSRCRPDNNTFEDLVLAPIQVRCGLDILDDFIMDSDGTILLCCQDFQRRGPVGKPSIPTVEEALLSVRRHAMLQRVAAGKHDLNITCVNCYGDGRITH